MSDSTSDAMGAADDPRRLRRAERAARKAQKAQDKADRARREALDAVRASGFDVNEPGAGKDRAAAESSEESDNAATRAAAGEKSGADKSGASKSSAGKTNAGTAVAGAAATATAAGSADAKASNSDTEKKGADTVTKGADTEKEKVGDDAGEDGTATSSSRTKEKSTDLRTASAPNGNPKLAKALLAVAAVFAVVAVVSWVGYSSQHDAVASEQAETNAPYEAADAARTIVTNMFTYDAEGVDEQLGRVEPQLTGEAEKEFRETTRPQVASLAKETEANSYATVAAVGLEERIDSDHVVTVMMLNRMVSTKDNPEAQNSSTRLRVSVDRVDEGDGQVWKVSKVEVL